MFFIYKRVLWEFGGLTFETLGAFRMVQVMFIF